MKLNNIIIAAVGVVLLIIGFICLATPGDSTVGTANSPISLTVAPLILSIAYLVVIPVGILWKGKASREENKADLSEDQK
ncbi:MAG: hypothetical protein MJY87_05630 [Fibrobacter sp.]|nr:hypothetical protein [Fibrobacter sp.]